MDWSRVVKGLFTELTIEENIAGKEIRKKRQSYGTDLMIGRNYRDLKNIAHEGNHGENSSGKLCFQLESSLL